jgi:hypothetical protein
MYNKNYLYCLDKKLTTISSLIEKWLRSSDEEKMKHITVDTSEFKYLSKSDFPEKKEEMQKSFELRKNQGLLFLNLADSLGKLILSLLKSF